MHIKRTRIKNDIIAEFSEPKRDVGTTKVIICAPGVPSVPNAKEVLTFWAQKNYWILYPRYRGTWESGGMFLSQSPARDIHDIVHHLTTHKVLTDLWSHVDIPISPDHIYVLGASFGGPAALFASILPGVTRSIALAPVVDWGDMKISNQMSRLAQYMISAYGNAYRFRKSDWDKMLKNTMYSPYATPDTIDASKCHIIHSQNDPVIPFDSVSSFCHSHDIEHTFLKTKKHFGIHDTVQPAMSKRIESHFHDNR